jgi:hypothetical protein
MVYERNIAIQTVIDWLVLNRVAYVDYSTLICDKHHAIIGNNVIFII